MPVQIIQRFLAFSNVLLTVIRVRQFGLAHHGFIVLSEGCTLQLHDLFIDLEHFVRLSAEPEVLETEGGLDEHEDGHFRFQGEHVSWEVISRYSLLKLTDLL